MSNMTKTQRLNACEILMQLRTAGAPDVVTRHEATWLSWTYAYTTPANWVGDHATAVRLIDLAMRIAKANGGAA